jgi:hypothetical protein
MSTYGTIRLSPHMMHEREPIRVLWIRGIYLGEPPEFVRSSRHGIVSVGGSLRN